ncbi:hypothetical protein [Cellulomonas sp. NPDC089187]|uniref:hypothetical protein n=1 Tax=Cellulomonas sp. NPDC089187 TaxID=3154970 RepID=UPI003433DFCE
MAGDIQFDEDAVLTQVNRLIELHGETSQLRSTLSRLAAHQSDGQWSSVPAAAAFATRVAGAIDEVRMGLEQAEARLQVAAQNLLDSRAAYEQQDADVRSRFDALARCLGDGQPTTGVQRAV